MGILLVLCDFELSMLGCFITGRLFGSIVFPMHLDSNQKILPHLAGNILNLLYGKVTEIFGKPILLIPFACCRGVLFSLEVGTLHPGNIQKVGRSRL